MKPYERRKVDQYDTGIFRGGHRFAEVDAKHNRIPFVDANLNNPEDLDILETWRKHFIDVDCPHSIKEHTTILPDRKPLKYLILWK